MGIEDGYRLGYIQKTHGLKGAVAAVIDSDVPEQYQNRQSVFLRLEETLVPFIISDISIKGHLAVIKFSDIDTIDRAKALAGSELWLPAASLPDLGPDKYYFHELIGFTVFDRETPVGEVTQVYQAPRCNLLAVDHEGTEVLIPMQEEIMLRVNKSRSAILTKLPDGLLEVYLEG